VPYTFDDIVRALNDVAPYDWATLLRQRVKATSTHAPLGGIERGGWRLVYNDKPNAYLAGIEKLTKSTMFAYSLGLIVGKQGDLVDVVPNSPAYQAGIGPGMKLVAVNGRRWTPQVLHDGLSRAQQDHQPIELIVETAEFFKTYSIAYFEGERNPHLERVEGQPDILGDILKPKIGSAGKPLWYQPRRATQLSPAPQRWEREE